MNRARTSRADRRLQGHGRKLGDTLFMFLSLILHTKGPTPQTLTPRPIHTVLCLVHSPVQPVLQLPLWSHLLPHLNSSPMPSPSRASFIYSSLSCHAACRPPGSSQDWAKYPCPGSHNTLRILSAFVPTTYCGENCVHVHLPHWTQNCSSGAGIFTLSHPVGPQHPCWVRG